MRIAALAAFAALALVACNQNTSTQTTQASAAPAPTQASNDVFPDLFGASYRADAVISRGGHTVNATTYRDGHKFRVEMQGRDGTQIIISNPEANESLMITSAAGRQVAMRMESTSDDLVQTWRTDMATTSHRTGDCNVAGERGSMWEHQDAGGANPRAACISSDGILLRATDKGETVWETTHVQRGRQDPALFRAPPGVRIMNLDAGAAAAARAAIERARHSN